MDDFIRKVILNFPNFDYDKKSFIFALLFDIKKYVIPISRCKLLVEETIDLEDKVYKYVDPISFYKFSFFRDEFNFSIDFLKNVVVEINEIFKDSGFYFEYSQRIKSVFSTMNRILERGFLVNDKFGIRIIFDSNFLNSYQFAWGIVENLSNNFKILKIKDFFSHPKKTGYSAIHVIILVQNISIEIQIISHEDMEIKVPHFKYKQYISQSNLYIEKDAKNAENKIIQDFKNYSRCHF